MAKTEDNVSTPSSHGLSAAAAGKITEVLDKETDGKLFAAVLYVITNMWGTEMGDLQRASLANQIVREIERRGIVAAPPVQMEAVAWQPIETAPTNGTQVDLWCRRSHGISAGGYGRVPDCWHSAGKWWRNDDNGDDMLRSEVHNATHWLPRPNSPFATSASPVPSSERDDIIGNWVKRSERLPTVGGTYLVGAYDDTMSLPRTFVRFWASFFLFDTGPEWQIRDAEHEHRTVEYWIDLPPHPEHPDCKPAGRVVRDDIIEMCARVVDEYSQLGMWTASETRQAIASAIRSLKSQPAQESGEGSR